MNRSYYAIGRRKEASAKVFFSEGNGYIWINKQPAILYLNYDWALIKRILAPLKLLSLDLSYDIIASVRGGGLHAQGEATLLSVSKLLASSFPLKKGLLRKKGFLSQDSRVKERKKYGLRKARKAPQFSKR